MGENEGMPAARDKAILVIYQIYMIYNPSYLRLQNYTDLGTAKRVFLLSLES